MSHFIIHYRANQKSNSIQIFTQSIKIPTLNPHTKLKGLGDVQNEITSKLCILLEIYF